MTTLLHLSPTSDVPLGAVLAQVPERLRGTTDAADIAVVSGEPGWVARVAEAVRSGVRAVLLDQPEPVGVTEVAELSVAASEAGVLVAVDTPYAGSPAWLAARDRLAADVAGMGILDAVVCIGPGGSAARAALAAVAVLRPLRADGVLDLVRAGDDLVVAASDAGSLAITLTVVRSSGAPGLTLTLVGHERRWHVVLPADGTAYPAEIAVHGADGARVERPHYESSRRATLAALHATLTGDVPFTGHTLDDLVEDLRAYPAGSGRE